MRFMVDPPEVVKPHDLSGVAAMVAADRQSLRKGKGEKDTAFVKRIVCAYLNAVEMLRVEEAEREGRKASS